MKASDALIRLMSALEDWEEARGTAQEERLLQAWTVFRASFDVQVEDSFVALLRSVGLTVDRRS